MGVDAPQHHTPIVRDFLGLGKLARGVDRAEAEGGLKGALFPGLAFGPCLANMNSTGGTHSILNIGPATEHRSSVPNHPNERYMEGSAETFGPSCLKQCPGIVVSTNARPEANGEPSAMQLTIFYGGRVNVFNNIPVDRMEAIMQLAASGNNPPPRLPTLPHGVSHPLGPCQPPTAVGNLHGSAQIVVPFLVAADQASENKPLECVISSSPSTATSPQPVVPRALPLARKASLARFLEKRKERIQMMSPYFQNQPSAGAPGERMLCLLQNGCPLDLHGQYTTPAMLFHMQEQTDNHSNSIPAIE